MLEKSLVLNCWRGACREKVVLDKNVLEKTWRRVSQRKFDHKIGDKCCTDVFKTNVSEKWWGKRLYKSVVKTCLEWYRKVLFVKTC